MKHLKKAIFLFAIALFIASCGETKQDPIEITPIKTLIENDFGGYFEIVDGNYKLESYDDGGYLGYIVQIEIKRNDKDFEFGIDSLELSGPTRTDLYIDITDEKGKPILDLDGYSTEQDDLKKLINSTINSSVWVRFYNTYGTKKEKVPSLPEGVVKFKTYSTLEFKSSYSYKSNKKNDKIEDNSQVNDTDNSSVINDKKKKTNVNWDKVLTKYEKFSNDYISLVKKISKLQDKGDDNSLAEVMKLMPKSMALNQQAMELSQQLGGAGGDLTAEQIAKFIKIQAIFSKAVLELSN